MNDVNDSNELIMAAQSLLEPDQAPAFVDSLPPQGPFSGVVEVVAEEISEPVVQSNIGKSLATYAPMNSNQLVSVHDQQVGVGDVQVYSPPPSMASPTLKFGDIPTQLREADGINTTEVKKLNLAIALEALERATQAHENFPSPDAGFAVSNLSEQVSKLTKELEKSMDPRDIMDDIVENALANFTKDIVQDLASEMKRLREETLSMARDNKKEAFDLAFKIAVNRMGPALKERLEVARTRVARALNVKEKPSERNR